MGTKIESVTVVTQQGVSTHFVGKKYNDLLLDRIDNDSVEYPDSIFSIYTGYTKEGDVVFTVENAPVEVSYKKEDD